MSWQHDIWCESVRRHAEKGVNKQVPLSIAAREFPVGQPPPTPERIKEAILERHPRVRWPTPRACSAMSATITPEAVEKAPHRFPNLETVVAMRTWATPTAHERTHTPRQVDHGEQLANQIGGALNPPWVEWLMGWPIGWTASEPLATESFRRWRRAHSSPCLES